MNVLGDVPLGNRGEKCRARYPLHEEKPFAVQRTWAWSSPRPFVRAANP